MNDQNDHNDFDDNTQIHNTKQYQLLKLNRNDFDLFLKLEKWYRKMSSVDYVPIIHFDKTNYTSNNNNNNELFVENNNNQLQQQSLMNGMVHDKKLKFYRPRFHTIELNFKMKLLICVMIRTEFFLEQSFNTESRSYHQMIEKYIKTINELIFIDFDNDLLYFYPDISKGTVNNSRLIIGDNYNENLDKLVMNNQDNQLYHVIILNYLIAKQKSNEYEFIMIITEKTFVHSYNFQQYLKSISISDYILSVSNNHSSNINGDDDSRLKFIENNFGHNDHILDNGLFISSSLISLCHNNWSCYVDQISKHYKMNTNHNVHFYHKSVSLHNDTQLISLNQEENILESIFIYPLDFYSDAFRLVQTLVAIDSINRLNRETENIDRKLHQFKYLESSPFLASFHSRTPKNRFEVQRWTYSNETHLFSPNDVDIIRKLDDEELKQIIQIKNKCLEWIRNHYQQSSIVLDDLNIENLYQKFDTVRGLETIVDLHVDGASSLQSSFRFQMLKSLNPVELLTDIPSQASENLRLAMILPVRGHAEVSLAISFLNHYANTCLRNYNHQTKLIIVLIRTRFNTLNDSVDVSLEFENNEFERLKKVSLYLQTKFQSNSAKIIFMDLIPPDAINSKLNSPRSSFPSEMAYLDLITRSLTATSPQESMLLLHCRSNMLFTEELLNRVRANTIADNQIFIPIPFTEYQLRTNKSNQEFEQILKQRKSKYPIPLSQLSINKKSLSMKNFDVRKDNGYFDDTNRQIVAFYLQDYIRARKQTETLMPIIRNRQSLVKYQHLHYNASIDLYEMFVQYNSRIIDDDNKLTIMIAIEPELKLYSTSILNDCDFFESNIRHYQTCRNRSSYGLGSKQKLAAIIYDYLNNNKL